MEKDWLPVFIGLKAAGMEGCLLFCHKRDSGGRVHAPGMERRSNADGVIASTKFQSKEEAKRAILKPGQPTGPDIRSKQKQEEKNER